jgi:RHS repeat-associated protein
MSEMILGFNGERLDPVTGTTHLGNGYRAYSPVLMRFICPDSWSPFGEGGINPYAYCDSDPVNRADPSGHFSVGGALGIVAGILGILFTPFTGGSSLAAALSVASVVAGVASVGLGIASELVSDARTAAGLGWAGFALGILSGVGAFAVGKLAPQAKSLGSLLGGRLMKSATGLQQRVRAYQKSRININLHPESARQTFHRKALDILPHYNDDGVINGYQIESAFYSDYGGTGQPGLKLHGRPGILETSDTGVYKFRRFNAREHTVSEFVSHMRERFGIDLQNYKPSKPLHLASCFSGGKDMNAQQMANVLGRDVIGYGDSQTIAISREVNGGMLTIEDSIPYEWKGIIRNGQPGYEKVALEGVNYSPVTHL